MSIYATLRSFMLEEIKKTNVRESERSAMLREHRAIAAAVFSGKGNAALEAFARHIETTRKQLRRSLDMGGARRRGAAPAGAAGGISRGKEK
jgi:DNA-binding FadR family transcriptional regulator